MNQDKNKQKDHKNRQKISKKTLILGLITFILFIAILCGIFFLLFHKKSPDTNLNPHNRELTEIEGHPVKFYDNLTGELIVQSGTQYDISGNKITDESGKDKVLTIRQAESVANEINSKPTFCVQIPNGMDGARPQVGLNQASVVFEAIAEAGITRFAAIFKNPASALAIGPIRSLRLYHLEWDAPFDCTIVHAGGADDALSAVSNGYKHLSESTTYMWRDYASWSGSILIGYASPNNLFTSGPQLARFHTLEENSSPSNPKSFLRLTPEESNSQKNLVGKSAEELQNSKTNNDSKNTSQLSPLPQASLINIRFGYQSGFNVNYTYNQDTNTYFRTYANGEAHTSYTCVDTGSIPKPKKDCGTPTQINPDIVIVMRVQERTSPLDNYHEDITTIGSGKAYVFQNGTFFEGTWHKTDHNSQLTFKNSAGEEIKLKPGRVWLSAIPDSYGQISFQ